MSATFFDAVKKTELSYVNEKPAKKNKTRTHNRSHSVYFALKGIAAILKQEPNFRIQLVLMALTMGTAAFLECSAGEWAAILICSGFVLAAEAVNTVTEELVDWIHPDHHAKAGRIKDMAAAVPLIASVFSLIAGLVIFVPKILALFRGLF